MIRPIPMGLLSFIYPLPAARLPVWVAALVLVVGSMAGLSGAAQTISATAVPLLLPSAVVFDSAGNLYLAETGGHVIRKVDPQGQITTVAGTGTQGFSGDGGLATQAQLDSPQGLAVAANTLYIADTHNHRVRALNLTTGILSTVAGSGTAGFAGDGGAAVQARLTLPTALSLDAKGNLYLADTGNHRIRRVDGSSGLIATVVGSGTQGCSGDNGPALGAQIDSPTGLAVDAAGNLYLADTHNHRVRRVDAASGVITTIAGTGVPGASAGQVNLPQGVTLDGTGNLYLADSANHRVLRIDGSTGVVTTVVGSGTQGYAGDTGPATAARLDSPRAVSVDASGEIALADTHNQRLRLVDAQSIVTGAGLGNPSPSSLTLSGATVIAYGTGKISATLNSSPNAAGSIVLLDTSRGATTILAVLPVAGNSVVFPLNTLPAGSHSLSATYAGDTTHGSAQSSAFALTVTPAPSVTTLSLSSTTVQPITVSALVGSATSGVPGGVVTLLEGTTPVGTATLSSGGASAVLPTLGPGTYSLSASYAGDNNFLPSTSAPTTLTIAPVAGAVADFTLAPASPTTQTIPAGASATYSFTTQTTGALSSPIALAAAGLPFGATASFNPAYLPPGSAANSFTLTVTTLKPAIKAAAFWLPVALGTMLLVFVRGGRVRMGRVRLVSRLSVVLFVALVFGMTACGDRISTANPQAATQPATYTITVTGTATSPVGAVLVHSAVVTLTLQ